MKTKTSYIPAGYHTATPYLIVNGAARAIEFYKQVFGAIELMRLAAPGGKVMHAEIQIGDSHIMLADESPEWDARGPQTLGGSPVSLLLYVEDVDAVIARAIAAGAKELRPVKDQFYGDRAGTVTDPFGHKWSITTHQEDVSPEEIRKRAAAFCNKARYLAHVRALAEVWLDWKQLGPLATGYQALLADEVKADARKLASFEAFQKGVAGDDGQAGFRGRGRVLSLKSFAEQRRAYRLNHPEVKSLGR